MPMLQNPRASWRRTAATMEGVVKTRSSWMGVLGMGETREERTTAFCTSVYHCRFNPRTDGGKLTVQNSGVILSSLLSFIPSTEARVCPPPSIVAAALHHEASSWILKNGLIFFALRLVPSIHSFDFIA